MSIHLASCPSRSSRGSPSATQFARDRVVLVHPLGGNPRTDIEVPHRVVLRDVGMTVVMGVLIEPPDCLASHLVSLFRKATTPATP